MDNTEGILETIQVEAAPLKGGHAELYPGGQWAGDNHVLDLIEIGVLIFSERKVVFHNRRAGEILAAKDGLRIDGTGFLRASSPAEDRSLQSIIRTIQDQPPDSQPATLTISRRSEKLPYPVMMKRLPHSPGHAHLGASPVAAFIRDPDHMGSIPWDAVAETFDLTPTEARLTRCLVEGSTPEEAARLLGINVSTVRWHMKQIFDKTGACRQGDLIRLTFSLSMPLRW